MVIGTSVQFGSLGSQGQSVWLWDGTALHRVGLVGPEYTFPNRHRSTEPYVYEPDGFLGGSSEAPDRAGNGRSTTWVYHNGVTTRVGLYDARRRRASDDWYHSGLQAISPAGDAIGLSYRFDAPTIYSAWYYDHATGVTIPIPFPDSERRLVSSTAEAFTPDGGVIGTYTWVEGENTHTYGFWWSPTEGLYRLDELIDGGIEASPWASITDGFTAAALADGSQLIVAQGALRSDRTHTWPVALTTTGRTLCLPDVNRDGFLDFFDYADFVDAFRSGDARADFNRDGFTDQFDYAAFVQAFETGC